MSDSSRQMQSFMNNTQALAMQQFTEGLPLLLVTLLERRYLTSFDPENWQIETSQKNTMRPLLREVVGLGKPHKEGEWTQVMPHVLNACHQPGHALMMVLHGQGQRHRLYLGAKRLVGSASHSTQDYLQSQESALKTYFSGLQMRAEEPRHLDIDELPELTTLLQTAPALAVVTGIPSGRGGNLPQDLQSLDRLTLSMSNERFALMVTAEPLDIGVIDGMLDACRHLKSEIHSFAHRSFTHATGESKGVAYTDATTVNQNAFLLPMGLEVLLLFLGGIFPAAQATNAAVTTIKNVLLQTTLVSSLTAGKLLLNQKATMETQAGMRQEQMGTSWQDSGTIDLLNANAEACEQILEQYIERLKHGKRNGWWRMAVCVAAENEGACQRITSALRSLWSGDATSLDPLRVLQLPNHLVRHTMEYGQILDLRPRQGTQGHPLGPAFDALATCINSDELAVMINLPQHEIPGLPMRVQSNFALSVPTSGEHAIALGRLQDSRGHDLEEVSLTSELLNRHCFITGLTGYGKTNTCLQILLEIHEKLHIPFLIVEPAKTEYRRLIAAPGFKNQLRIYTFGEEFFWPFRLNPLSPVPGIPLARHIDLLKAVFNASFPMFAGMNYVLEEALIDVYTERGWNLYTSSNPFLGEFITSHEQNALIPCLEDLHDQIDVVMNRKKYAREVHDNMGAALRSRLQSLMNGTKGLALNTRRSIPLRDLFARPTIIELQNLGDDEEKAFVMALLFTQLYEYAETRLQDTPPKFRGTLQHLTLIEEAHRLLQATHSTPNPEIGDPRAKAVSMFTDMLAEMRAYGEGFLIADQIPTKLAPEILKNSGSKIIHRLAAPDDRQVAGSCINLDEQQTRYLNNLPPGFAIVHNEQIGEAVLTKIHSVQDRPYLNPENLQDVLPPAIKREEKLYLYRHGGCRSCPSPCDFYRWVDRFQSQKQTREDLEVFLHHLYAGHLDQAWTHWSKWYALNKNSARISALYQAFRCALWNDLLSRHPGNLPLAGRANCQASRYISQRPFTTKSHLARESRTGTE